MSSDSENEQIISSISAYVTEHWKLFEEMKEVHQKIDNFNLQISAIEVELDSTTKHLDDLREEHNFQKSIIRRAIEEKIDPYQLVLSYDAGELAKHDLYNRIQRKVASKNNYANMPQPSTIKQIRY
jgi:uncharacterized coiled-coil protein SlyX